jgi:hypothetical protein
MRFKSGQQFRQLPSKAVTVLGMSGVGKTTVAQLLQSENWFQYSVDYRIGTRYMGEHIVDNFKREAMKNVFLRELLRSDSIYIRSNISFNNLEPLSTYLGKPGNPSKGGIPLVEYKRRQQEHREAEISALLDVPGFIRRATEIYQYPHFICDSGGSLCEVVDPSDPSDHVLQALSDTTLLLYIESTPEHERMLIDRFCKQPKPMYYQPAFLEKKWAEFKQLHKLVDDNQVDPDAFAIWGFSQLIHHRRPLYEAIANNFGYRLRMQDIPAIRNAGDFVDLVSTVIDKH